jgi:hypothetical protein
VEGVAYVLETGWDILDAVYTWDGQAHTQRTGQDRLGRVVGFYPNQSQIDHGGRQS